MIWSGLGWDPQAAVVELLRQHSHALVGDVDADSFAHGLLALEKNWQRTESVCVWHFHPDAMAEPGFSPDAAVAFWDLTNRRDWHVCEQMQLGVRSRAYRPGPYSNREDLLHGFDQLIRSAEWRVRSTP